MVRAARGQAAGVWRERLRRFKSAGLSVAEFCRREQVSQQSFFSWRRRLGSVSGRPKSKKARPPKTKLSREPRKQPHPTPRFVQLPPPSWSGVGDGQLGLTNIASTHGALAGSAPSPIACIQLTLPSGAIVQVSNQASPDLIAAAFQAAMLAPRATASVGGWSLAGAQIASHMGSGEVPQRKVPRRDIPAGEGRRC